MSQVCATRRKTKKNRWKLEGEETGDATTWKAAAESCEFYWHKEMTENSISFGKRFILCNIKKRRRKRYQFLIPFPKPEGFPWKYPTTVLMLLLQMAKENVNLNFKVFKTKKNKSTREKEEFVNLLNSENFIINIGISINSKWRKKNSWARSVASPLGAGLR